MFNTNGNGLDAANDQPAKFDTKHTAYFTGFTGTTNLRHFRVIQALLTRSRTREEVDLIAGCSNGPELIAELRRRGLEVPCTRTKKLDRDLFDCWPGVYHFTNKDRRKIKQWKSMRGGTANA